MDVSVSGTVDQKAYLKKFRGGFSPLSPPPWIRLCSCNSSRRECFMREKFFKNEISKINSQKTSERLGNTDLFSVDRYELKNILRLIS